MATASDSHEVGHESTATGTELRVSAYDKFASMLIASLIVIGFFVLVLLGIWLTGRLFLTQAPIAVDWLPGEDRSDRTPGFGPDMEEPGMEEMEELKEPQIEDTLNDVKRLVTSQSSVLAAIERNATVSPPGGGEDDRGGKGPMVGKRVIDGVIPRYERWEIRFSTSGIETYAQQLDFFKIELGAAGGGSAKVDYAFNLVKPKPDRRSGDSEDEDRLYMSWRKDSGPMAAFDRQLMTRAGISTHRRLILQFYPKKTEQLLQDVEFQAAAEAQGTTPQELDPRILLKTVFGVLSVRDGYLFYVIDQYFRPAPMP